MYGIWSTVNFPLFSMDLICRLILVHLNSYWAMFFILILRNDRRICLNEILSQNVIGLQFINKKIKMNTWIFLKSATIIAEQESVFFLNRSLALVMPKLFHYAQLNCPTLLGFFKCHLTLPCMLKTTIVAFFQCYKRIGYICGKKALFFNFALTHNLLTIRIHRNKKNASFF